MKTILVCIDFSDITQRVVQTATQLATALGSRVLLLHVAPPEPDFVPYEVGPQAERDAVAKLLRQEHQKLQVLEQQLINEDVSVEALMVQGPAAQKILQEARVMNADLIVMGSHGHGAVYELLVGSVTETVLRKTHAPVLVVPLAGQNKT